VETSSQVAVSTSLLRTYRNLRLAIAGTVVLLGIAVWSAALSVGILPSISAYFYTSARSIFVGSLVAAAIAILVLSGRGVERALLDAAGLFAPLIAFVPTPIRPGTIPGYGNACALGTVCVPKEALPGIATGITSYLIAGVLALIVAGIVTCLRWRKDALRPRDVVPSFAVAIGVLAMVAAAWIWANDFFVNHAHLIAAAAFFGLIAAVAVVKVFERPRPPERGPARWHKAAYWVIAVGMLVDSGVIVVLVATKRDIGAIPPPVFVGEFIALALFVIFWLLQTVQKWDAVDPRFGARE
jgi:hypothetical protein